MLVFFSDTANSQKFIVKLDFVLAETSKIAAGNILFFLLHVFFREFWVSYPVFMKTIPFVCVHLKFAGIVTF